MYNFTYLCIYLGLNNSERDTYLKQLLDDSDDESLVPSDSDDEDWFPAQAAALAVDISDSEESGDNETGEQQGQERVEAGNGNKMNNQKEKKKMKKRMKLRVKQREECEAREEINTTFVAKNKTIWSKVPLSQHQAAVRNIVRQRAGAHRSTKN